LTPAEPASLLRERGGRSIRLRESLGRADVEPGPVERQRADVLATAREAKVDVDDREHAALVDRLEDARLDHVDAGEVPALHRADRIAHQPLAAAAARREAEQPFLVEE